MSNLFSSGGAGNVGFSGETQQSLKFNDDESQYLSWTPAAAGNRKTWTWSGWVKRGNIGINSFIFGCGSSGTNFAFIGFSSDNTIDIRDYQGSYTYSSKTSQVFRDTSAFYHLVLVADMNNATSADRIKLYVNGERVTSFNSAPSPTTKDLVTNSAVQHVIGSGYYNDGSGVNNYLDGYLSDIHFIDGQALDASSFGQFTNGYWEKIDYAGTYGTNGFHLTFQDDVVSEGFNAVTYAGNGSADGQSISGLGFSPDLVWLKERTNTSANILIDTVRGANITLESNNTNAEFTPTSVGLESFDGDGFTIGSANGAYNSGSDTYVAWAWDAGSGSAASNTDGSITSTVKANPDYGFSVATYTGTGGTKTVGHGLGTTPAMVIVKSRSSSSFWKVWHKDLTSGNNVLLNDTAAQASYNNRVGTNNTASVVEVIDGTSSVDNVNDSGGTYVMYSFAEVAGYSSIGSYSGTGSSGNSVTTGFRPAFVMVKDANSGTSQWVILDATRNTSNPISKKLAPNTTAAENDASLGSDTQNLFDFTDTGFTLTTGNGNTNLSGGNFIYMAFADTREAAFWKDVSGQGNHWTPNNLDYRDSLIDSPANNFCTGNPLKSYTSGSAMVYAEGNLKLDRPGTGTGWASSFGTMSMSSGKWYWEAKCFDSGSADEFIGIHEANTSMFQIIGYSGDPTGYSYNASSGNKYNNNTGTSYGASYADGDVIGVALDMDAGTVTFYKNGASQGTAFTGLSGDFIPAFSSDYSTGYGYWIANFGQDSTFSGATTAGGNQDDNGIGDFAYPVPSGGYLALCTANLPTPSIVDGSEHFNTVLYTGTGATQSITGVGFGSAPDFVWLKGRSYAEHHHLYDTIRGATEVLYSNRTVAEASDTLGLTSFDSDGFSIGSRHEINNSGDSFVGWSWKAGGTAVSNTDGSITSQVSANTDAGFSIVSWVHSSTTSTIGHGLTTAPNLIILKSRTTAYNWDVGSDDIGWGNRMNLNSTAAAYSPAFWNSTAPTSSVFTYAGSGATNGDNMIAYCFANSDIIKAGSYTGNGSSDGPFVYTGGRVQWLLLKDSSFGTSQWLMMDNARDDDNPVTKKLSANISDAENSSSVGNDSQNLVDFLSNGFKLRTSNGNSNASGVTYIYLAILESPLKFANAR